VKKYVIVPKKGLILFDSIPEWAFDPQFLVVCLDIDPPEDKKLSLLTEDLNVRVCYLQPDIEVAKMLDAVASFQQDDYVMTEAEAIALEDTSQPNRPKIQVKSLPVIESWPIPTDEDARWRPRAQVSDYKDEQWVGIEMLVYVDMDAYAEKPFLDSNGANWKYCRIPPEEKARCDYLNKIMMV
jgi:hypothetical protein